jgi:choline-sulfatase
LINANAPFTLAVMMQRLLAVMGLLLLSFTASAKPNIILITLDSARADHMGFLGAKNATPNLDHLAAESLVFEHAYAQSPSSVVSHATILSGSYPQITGITAIGGTLATSLPSLPDQLKSQGYRTAAFVSSIDLDPVNGLAQGFDRGFQSYDAGFRPPILGDARPPATERSGAQTVTRAQAWLDQNAKSQQPFFLWIHIAEARKADVSYKASLAVADATVGKLTTALRQRKLYDDAVLIVTGANGMGLNAHGEDSNGIFLYDETIHVPLLIKLPKSHAGDKTATTKVTAKVRLVDIAPTVLEIASIPIPSQMQGQSLLRAAKSSADQPAYSRSDLPQRGFGWSSLESWRVGKYLYIRAPKPELYDLIADPAAVHNLAQSSKATLDTMASQLDSFDRRFSGDASKSSAELSSTEMQKLASLGYVGLTKSSSTATTITGIDPKDKIAIANKVVEAANLGQAERDRAIALLNPIVASDTNLYLAQYTLGVALSQKKQYAEAAKYLHKAIELQPDSAWANYEIGAILLKSGDFKTAIVHLEIATTHLPSFAPAHTALAQAYEKVGRADDAKRERSKGR